VVYVIAPHYWVGVILDPDAGESITTYLIVHVSTLKQQQQQQYCIDPMYKTTKIEITNTRQLNGALEFQYIKCNWYNLLSFS